MSNERITGIFDLVASTFDQVGPRFFSHSGRRLVELAQITIGADVLDVATGRGAVLFPVTEWIGLSGRVIGVDMSGGMVCEIAKDVKRIGLRQVEICRMDAERLGFADSSFDFVLSAHAIFYFPQALGAFHRILKPGGQVGVSIVAKGCLDWIFEMITRHLPEEGGVKEDEGENGEDMAIDTAGGLEEVLVRAGFEGIRVIEEETDFIYVDEEEWWSALRTLGVRELMEKMEVGALKRLKTEMFDYLQAFKQSDGVHVLYRVLYALGSKADR